VNAPERGCRSGRKPAPVAAADRRQRAGKASGAAKLRRVVSCRAAGDCKRASSAVKRSPTTRGKNSSRPIHENLKQSKNAAPIARRALLRNFVEKRPTCGKCVVSKSRVLDAEKPAAIKSLPQRTLRRREKIGPGRSVDPSWRTQPRHTWRLLANLSHRPRAPHAIGGIGEPSITPVP
jgi:hypothetical protein